MFTIDHLRTVKMAVLFTLLLTFLTSAAFAQKGSMPLSGTKEAIDLFNQGLNKSENLEDPGDLFDRAVKADPNFALGYTYAGQTNREAEDNLAKAIQLLDKASPGERELILAAKAQNDGDAEGRRSHLEKLVQLYPMDKRAHSLLGVYFRGIGDEATALMHFKESVRIDKKFAPAYNNIGYSNMALGNMADAESAFKTYIKLIPDNPNPYDSYAEMLMRNGKFNESIAQYKLALAKSPVFLASYRGIGNNYQYMGNSIKARETYQMMWDKAANDGQRDAALQYIINSYIADGDVKNAFATNEKRLEIPGNRDTPQAIYGIHGLSAAIAIENGDADTAASHFSIMEKMMDDPSLGGNAANRRFNAMSTRARLLLLQGKADDAAREVDGMREIAAKGKNVNQQRNYSQTAGFVALHNKDYAKAKDLFGQGFLNDPFNWYYQAVSLEGAGDKAGAAALYKKIVDWNRLITPGYAIVRARALRALQK